MRISKTTETQMESFIAFLQFMDHLSGIDLDSKESWDSLKQDLSYSEAFSNIMAFSEDNQGFFNLENFLSFFSMRISPIWGKVVFGYETLVDNCCDSEKDYLDFNEKIKKGLELFDRNF